MSILDNPAVRQAVLPVTVEQYHRWGESGLIRENTELLRGIIVEKSKSTQILSRRGIGRSAHFAAVTVVG
jgi:hypothetical protein